MAILTDQEFIDAVEQTPKIIPRSLWQHLNEIAQYLALIGDVEAAYEVWQFAYRDIPYVPEYLGDYADWCVTALCHHYADYDLSEGSPRSDMVKPGYTLQQRTKAYDRNARRELLRLSRKVLLQFQGATPFSPSELEVLPHLDAYLAETLVGNQWNGSHPSGYATLIGADIAFRHGQESRATGYLHEWKMRATPANTLLHYVFGLITTARLIFRGALVDTVILTGEQRLEFVRMLLAPPSASESYLLNPPKAPTEITIWPDYSTLSFEPSWDVDSNDSWNLSEHEEMIAVRPDEPYPISVHLMTPWSTGDCIITVEYPDAVPDWNEAMHAYAFPIRVEPNPRAGHPDGVVGTLFPSTLPCGIGDEGFEVPPGEYDALARFFFTKDSDIGFGYRVVVSLMPRGTMAHGILKLDEAKLAEIRNNTQEADSAPE